MPSRKYIFFGVPDTIHINPIGILQKPSPIQNPPLFQRDGHDGNNKANLKFRRHNFPQKFISCDVGARVGTIQIDRVSMAQCSVFSFQRKTLIFFCLITWIEKRRIGALGWATGLEPAASWATTMCSTSWATPTILQPWYCSGKQYDAQFSRLSGLQLTN